MNLHIDKVFDMKLERVNRYNWRIRLIHFELYLIIYVVKSVYKWGLAYLGFYIQISKFQKRLRTKMYTPNYLRRNSACTFRENMRAVIDNNNDIQFFPNYETKERFAHKDLYRLFGNVDLEDGTFLDIYVENDCGDLTRTDCLMLNPLVSLIICDPKYDGNMWNERARRARRWIERTGCEDCGSIVSKSGALDHMCSLAEMKMLQKALCFGFALFVRVDVSGNEIGLDTSHIKEVISTPYVKKWIGPFKLQ